MIHKSIKDLAIERFSPMEGSDLVLIDDLAGSLSKIAVSPISNIQLGHRRIARNELFEFGLPAGLEGYFADEVWPFPVGQTTFY